MSNRSSGAAALVDEPVLQHEHDPPFAPVEADFFARGDAGRFEPPVYLPVDSLLLPLAGVAFLAVLTVLALH